MQSNSAWVMHTSMEKTEKVQSNLDKENCGKQSSKKGDLYLFSTNSYRTPGLFVSLVIQKAKDFL